MFDRQVRVDILAALVRTRSGLAPSDKFSPTVAVEIRVELPLLMWKVLEEIGEGVACIEQALVNL